jgi:MFS family permease
MHRNLPRPLSTHVKGRSPAALIAWMSAAHVLSMLGFSTWPTLLPVMQPVWQLSSAQAGLVSGIFFGGYMVLVPFLSGLTDRMDARRVYGMSCVIAALGSLGFSLFAQGLWTALLFQFLNGAGIAGTYMPGLKLLADHTSGATQSRGVSVYTSVFGVGASLSILLAGTINGLWGWEMAFGLCAAGPLLSAALVLGTMPAGQVHQADQADAQAGVARIKAVFAQGDAARYILGYCVHCWELFGSRSWLVAFLASAAMGAAASDPHGSAVMVAALANLIAPLASIGGNELAIRRGRDPVVWNAMFACALLTACLGFLGWLPWPVLGVLAVIHVFALMGDSGALTAGMVAASSARMRGISMAVHSTLGFGAGFISPLVFGLVLDGAGGRDSQVAWGLAYATLALPVLAGSFLLRPRSGGRNRPGVA